MTQNERGVGAHPQLDVELSSLLPDGLLNDLDGLLHRLDGAVLVCRVAENDVERGCDELDLDWDGLGADGLAGAQGTLDGVDPRVAEARQLNVAPDLDGLGRQPPSDVGARLEENVFGDVERVEDRRVAASMGKSGDQRRCWWMAELPKGRQRRTHVMLSLKASYACPYFA